MSSISFINKVTSFFSIKTNGRSQLKSPLDRIKRIENIFKEGLKSSSLLTPEEKAMSEPILKDKLIREAGAIRDTYLNKTSKMSFLKGLFRFHQKEKAIKNTYLNIQLLNNKIQNSAQSLFALPNELNQHIISFLPTKDALSLAGATKEMVESVKYAKLVKAREYGYVGNDLSEAEDYLKDLFIVVKSLVKSGDIPDYKGESLSAEVIFRRIKFSNDKETTQRLNQALFKYAAKGDKFKVVVLLLMGADINARNDTQTTPLHVAVMCDAFGMVQFLLEKGAKLEAQDKDLNTPLHKALYSASITEFLVENGANVNAKNKDDMTPLMGTVKEDISSSVMRLLLKYKAVVEEIDSRNQKGNTALHFTAYYNQHEKVKLLLDNGADRSLINIHGKQAVDLTQDAGIIKLLE